MPKRICRLLLYAFLAIVPETMWAQTSDLPMPQAPDADGYFVVPAKDLKTQLSSPKVAFPQELANYEISDTVVVEVKISPDGNVTQAKAIKGKYRELKEAAEKTVKKWSFEPYLINGKAVAVRSDLEFLFDNSLDRYRDPDGDAPVRLEQKTAADRLVKSVPPVYPRDARARGVQGSVKLRALIGKDGRVHMLHILTGDPLLATAAFNAVRQWQYKPYEQNGKILPVDMQITVNFTLSRY